VIVGHSSSRHARAAQPEDLGAPDVANYQDKLDMLALAWLDPDDPALVNLSLYEFVLSIPSSKGSSRKIAASIK